LHNRASVQSAATKYHIPRETLRRHYQRYLKAIGINKVRPPSFENPDSTHPPSVLANDNNSINGDVHCQSSPEDKDISVGFSSLMDIGKAFGIWNGGNFKPSLTESNGSRNTDTKNGKKASGYKNEDDNEDD